MSEQSGQGRSRERGRSSNACQAVKRPPHSPESRRMCYDLPYEVSKKFNGNDKVREQHPSRVSQASGTGEQRLSDSSSSSSSSQSEIDEQPPQSESAGSESSSGRESASPSPYVPRYNDMDTGLAGAVGNPPACTGRKSDGRVAGPSGRNNTATADGGITISDRVGHREDEMPCELTLDKLIYITGTMINTDHRIFRHRIIDDLATYFMHADLLTNADGSPASVGGRLFGDLLKTLIKMFDGAKHNMVILTGCLVCVYWKIAVKTPLPETKDKLPMFVRVIGKYVRQLDGAMWAQWFSNDAITSDWFNFIASVFIPSVNFVAAEDRRVIDHAIKYLEKIKYHRYACAVDKKPVKIPKTDENRTLKVDVKNRTGRTCKKNVAENISRAGGERGRTA